MAVASNFPAIRPSLNLDFANARALDPRITFSRASAATYYDGKTVAKAEENLLTYSQDFDNAAWIKANGATITANSSVAPDGTTTADTLTFSSDSLSSVNRTAASSATGPYTFSVWLRVEAGTLDVRIRAGNGVSITVTATTVWQRFSVTETLSGSSSVPVIMNAAPASSSVYIWGAQLEQRSQVTAYTPTTTQPITNYIPVLQTAPAGVPRFDHNPVTGESLGLLVEEQRSNMLNWSEQFSNSYWTKANATVQPNTVIGPDGALTADKIIPDTSSGASHNVNVSTLTSAVGSTYTGSCYIKAGELTNALLVIGGGGVFSPGSAVVAVNLLTGTATPITGGTSGGHSAYSISPVGNGWYRVSVSGIAVVVTTFQFTIIANVGSTFDDRLLPGNNYSGIYIWGAQLEVGDKATSYIKTEASQVTRAADPNLTAALGQPGAGTIYVDATVRSGSTLATSGATTFAATASTRQKTAVAYDAASTRKSINGAAVTSSAGTQGGSNISIAPGATGWISKLSIYPQKFGDAHLQSLTA